MNFLYFVPKRGRLDFEQVKKIGLGYAFEKNPVPCGVDSGPDSQRGTVLAVSDDGIGYYPDKQTWRKIPGLECDAWVGVENDRLPHAEDLARDELVNGDWITDDRDDRWLAPKARRWGEFDGDILWDYSLPRRLQLDENGDFVPGDLKPRYQKLWGLALDYLEAATLAMSIHPDEDKTLVFTFERINDLVFGALQLNYRIGPIEIDLLGIYDDEFRKAVIDALLDNRRCQELIKKKLLMSEQTGGSSSSGPSQSKPEAQATTAPQ